MRACCLALLLAACGGAHASPSDATDAQACDVARLDAERAWRDLAEGAQEAAARLAESDGPPLRLEAVAEQLRAHVAALEAEPREVPGEEAFALANGMMEGVDEVAADLDDGLRQRADDAAEAILTDRTAAGSRQASLDAAALIDEVVRQARPGRAAAQGHAGVGELARRADDAAEAYARGVAEGDQAAARAEEAPAGDWVEARQRAVDASAEARSRCGVDRTLVVPAPM